MLFHFKKHITISAAVCITVTSTKVHLLCSLIVDNKLGFKMCLMKPILKCM